MAGCLEKLISGSLERTEAASDKVRSVIQNTIYKASMYAATTNEIQYSAVE